MNKIETGGPAFPGKAYSGLPNEGLSLRDYFAAKAMQSMCGETQSKDFDHCARRSYLMADQMLKARK